MGSEQMLWALRALICVLVVAVFVSPLFLHNVSSSIWWRVAYYALCPVFVSLIFLSERGNR